MNEWMNEDDDNNDSYYIDIYIYIYTYFDLHAFCFLKKEVK